MDKAGKGRSAGPAPAREVVLEGLAVSPGIAVGSAHLRESGEIRVLEYQIPAKAVGGEKERF